MGKRQTAIFGWCQPGLALERAIERAERAEPQIKRNAGEGVAVKGCIYHGKS